jgi:N6-adenosine-specific RNA methylase IME4
MLERSGNPIAQMPALIRALEKAETAEEVLRLEGAIDSAEAWIKKNGLGIENVRPANEARMWARWRLGQLLALILTRPAGKRRGSEITGLPQKKAELERLGLAGKTVVTAERIGCLPRGELAGALKKAREQGVLMTLDELVRIARPYWAKFARAVKHKAIRDKAAEVEGELGPFNIVLADPPWRWGAFNERDKVSESGGRMPDEHYPTLSHEEIIGFKVQNKLIRSVVAREAALFLWCTSSNLDRAREVMAAWGFIFKASAIWAKIKDDSLQLGTGFVFRNAHEVLLYGTRGDMPGPQYLPPSVFVYPRKKHSEKPVEVRRAIERMFPDFEATTRLELFARDKAKGWTGYGYEA